MAVLAPIASTNFTSTIPNPYDRMSYMLLHGNSILSHLIARLEKRSSRLNFEDLLEDVAIISTTPSAAIDSALHTSKTINLGQSATVAAQNIPFEQVCARTLLDAHDVMRQVLWTLEELEAARTGFFNTAALDAVKTGVEDFAKLLHCAEEMVCVLEEKAQWLREQVFNGCAQ